LIDHQDCESMSALTRKGNRKSKIQLQQVVQNNFSCMYVQQMF